MNNFENQPTNPDNNGFSTLSSMPSFEQWQAEQAKETEATPEQLENFRQFVDFFKKDSDIKKSLTELAPSDQDFYGDGTVKYADKLYDGIKDITSDIKGIMANYYKSEDIEKRLKQIEEDVINAGANPDKLAQVYRRDFAAMSEELNNDIHQETVGYSAWNNPHQLDSKATSVNEILHLIHSSIVNNESILQSLPVLDKTEDRYGSTTLYGTTDSENPVAKEIYEQIKNGDESYTDIITLPDRTLMMVRDRGHALTVDVEKDPTSGKFFINYFVPKICNVDKVNQLPGVRKVAKKEGEFQVGEFTTGVFSVDNESDVATSVISFVKMVPTDDDIVLPNYF